MLTVPGYHPFIAQPSVPPQGTWLLIEPAIAVGVILTLAAYFYAIGPLRRRYRLAERVDGRQVAYFVSAMVIIFVSLQGPLHVLSDYYSLSAHMIQHLLVTLIMPPLLLKGIPAWLIDPVLRHRLILPVARVVLSPFVAFGFFNAIFAVWHAPSIYQLALEQPPIHALEHILFMDTAILTWWPIFSPSKVFPRLSEPVQMLYLFCASVLPTILGALITFADFEIYPFYGSASRLIGLSPLDDQQAAGLLMWLGGAGVTLTILTHRFFVWMERDADEPLPTPQG